MQLIDGHREGRVLTAQEVQDVIHAGLPMAQDLDLRIERLDSEGVLARVPFSTRLVRPGGTVSGPTMMALADAAMYAVVMGRLGRVEMAVTSNLNINFLVKPQPVDLLADARILRLSKRQAVCEVLLYSAGNEGELVAHVTGTYALPL
ncbi:MULTISPECIES: PaaI family thioesterase [Pseudomonas]|uniref:PaaI family thioesterase n=2 Tax=Pseudomonas TaxID=286 RepID=UPI000B8542B8|nr:MULTISPECIES: PaaI family thioesterase [Pseudomonas]HCP56922.1 PaaI family thioesterase [Pseudomonas sp.]|tara:strand:- start:151 stop:594 length:444 start_codon:yes stop_codon:yes gene_type:complete